jgi:hypothetical protein
MTRSKSSPRPSVNQLYHLRGLGLTGDSSVLFGPADCINRGLRGNVAAMLSPRLLWIRLGSSREQTLHVLNTATNELESLWGTIALDGYEPRG